MVSTKPEYTCAMFIPVTAGTIHPWIAESIVASASRALESVATVGRVVPENMKDRLKSHSLQQKVRQVKGSPSSKLVYDVMVPFIAEDTEARV